MFFFPFQLIGCVIIGYMAWVLATSVTVSKFIDGSLVSCLHCQLFVYILGKSLKEFARLLNEAYGSEELLNYLGPLLN